LPAALAAAAIGVGFALASPAKSLLTHYEAAGKSLLQAKDYKGALLCYERLVRLAPKRADFRFLTAILFEQLGRNEQAEALVRSIAPGNRTGYPPAHLWLARRLMSVFTLNPGAAAVASAAEAHLLRTLQGAPDTAEAKLLLGKLYSMIGRPKEALPLLETVPGDQPDGLLDLGRVQAALGDSEASQRSLRAARKSARTRAEANTDDKLAWLNWASIASNSEEYGEALEALKKGFRLSGDPAFPRAIAAVCSAWSTSLQSRGIEKAAERFSVIKLGLEQDPANATLLGQLGELLSAPGETGEAARAQLLDALAAGRAPALAHFALGSDAWERKQPETARTHWEQAYKLDPRLPSVANNLAWLLSHREPTDLPRALAIIDDAVTQVPTMPRLRGTRGEVLLKMERWKDAVTDLESALAAGENTAEIHESLAIAYEHLAVPELAARHRKLVKP
jgi:tetratricopeptide (TPR) repeat protein